MSIPAVCADFLLACSSHAPEERFGIGEKAINLIHQFLEAVAKEIQKYTRKLCHDRITLSCQVRMSCDGHMTAYNHVIIM